jgi:spermidine synthase
MDSIGPKGTCLDSPHNDLSIPVPFLCEEDGLVTLCFEIGSVQSRMLADAPDHLVLSYTRTMMDFLLFKRLPRRIAMIGLGGGSMAKWCYRHVPQADITVVEINPHVIGLRDRFRIPEDNHRFRVLCEDGADYVARTSCHTDVLIVDGFNLDGQPPELCSQSFYDDCHQALTASGLMVVNLCGDDQSRILTRIRRSFHSQVLTVTPETDGNTIVFACKGEPLWSRDESCRSFLTKLRKSESGQQFAKAS